MHKAIIFLGLFLLCENVALSQCDACESLNDRIINGDFESGNTGFTSSLDYVTFFPFICTLCPENTYAIGNNATLFHNGFTGTDHTNPPSGDYFIANAPGEAGAAVWCQSIPVLPQTNYTFSFWARDIANNSNPHPLAVLRPSFNGLAIADSLIAEGGWSNLTVSWYSENATQLDICILDFQTQTGGNDFGLDDISLTACEPIVLSQEVFAGEDTVICSRDILNLGVPTLAGYNYQWSASSALSSQQTGSPTFQWNNTTGMAEEFTLWVSRDSANVGCVASDTITITVLPMNELNLGQDRTICPYDSVQISAGNGWDSIYWSTNLTASIGWFEPGIYSATVFTGICSDSDTIQIIEYEMQPTGLASHVDHCNTESLILNSSVNGEWLFNNTSASNPIIAEESGTYLFTYSDSACFATDTVEVLLFERWLANLPADTVLCSGTSITIPSDHVGLWNTGAISESILIKSAGIYAVEIENGPCFSTDSISITGLELPELSLGNDTTFCEDYPIILDAYYPGALYLWSTGDTTASILTSGSNTYSVEVTNLCGTLNEEIQISNYPCSWGLHIPSGFTPNDDTFNEGWMVYGYNIRAINLVIYNRFGDAIFKTTELNKPWIPSSNMGDDIYNYRIEVTPYEGQTEVRTGAIYLLR
jgi:gliding motility-associated-like protein